MIPTVGRIVHYTLCQQDVDAVNRRRADATANVHPFRYPPNLHIVPRRAGDGLTLPWSNQNG